MWVALACSALALFLVATTFLRDAPRVPTAFGAIVSTLILPVYGAALLRELARVNQASKAAPNGDARKWWKGRGKNPMRELFAPVPRVVRFASNLFWLAMWVAAISSFVGPSGDPSTRDGRYFLTNHGEVTEVSRSEYDRAVTSSTRGFASVACAFHSMAFVLCLYGRAPEPDRS
jgi:hypothetical protein